MSIHAKIVMKIRCKVAVGLTKERSTGIVKPLEYFEPDFETKNELFRHYLCSNHDS